MVWTCLGGRAVVSYMVSDSLDLGGRAVVFMVSDGLDLGGQGYGVCWFGPWWSGLWCLWCLMVVTWVIRAMAPMVSDGLGLGGRRLWCLWCLMVWAWVIGAMVSTVSGPGWSGYGAYGV